MISSLSVSSFGTDSTSNWRRKRVSGQIFYARRPEYDTAAEKLSWLGATRARQVKWERIEPDKSANWINQAENDWDALIPVADKKTKLAKARGQERAVFKTFVSGIKSNRDEWAYGHEQAELRTKYEYFRRVYDESDTVDFDGRIKWSRDLKVRRRSRKKLSEHPPIVLSTWRPFTSRFFVWESGFNDIFYEEHLRQFGENGDQSSPFISISGTSSAKPFQVLGGAGPRDYEAVEKNNLLPRYRYTSTGERIDNITDWALDRFRKHYGPKVSLTKDDIFHYVYAALHDPKWRETYAINLRREFPRLPFHAEFHKWVRWGRRLMELHIGYEAVEPWPVTRTDTPDAAARSAGLAPKPVLKSEPGEGRVVLDSETVLEGIPSEAWDYRLGNRSALDWVLDQHREKRPKDPTIRERFDTYRFADHKERVADLIARVARVSVETVAIVAEMRRLGEGGGDAI